MSELGSSLINLSGCPRFPAYSVGHSSFAAQQNQTGFGPRVPWDPSMGFPRGPPPQFPLRYSQVIPIRGEQVYNPASGKPVINDDPKAEIKILHQQLAQAQEKQAALDSQISNLCELVQKQQEEFDSKILKFQTREKEQDQANIERQKVWEEERKREQAKWKAQEKAWKERSQRELQEREWGWAKELEKKKREWEREQKGNGKQEARMGFLRGDQRFQIIWSNTLGKWGINIKTRILSRIIEWTVPVQGVDILPKEIEVVT